MLGAIIGDIVGSRFEWNNYKDKEFELFTEDCRMTDDSIMTLAVAKALLETEKAMESVAEGQERKSDYFSLLKKMSIQYMQAFGRRYPDFGFSRAFYQWIVSEEPQPYNSYGNGAAMRISPVAYVGRTDKEIQNFSETVTGVSHNHAEGLKGAEATATAIFRGCHPQCGFAWWGQRHTGRHCWCDCGSPLRHSRRHQKESLELFRRATAFSV